MNLIERLKKRRCFPVTIEGIVVAHVRAMTLGECERVDRLPREIRTGFVMGKCLVNEHGVPEFVQEQIEADESFAKRVETAMAEVDTLTIADISSAIGMIGKINTDDIAKN